VNPGSMNKIAQSQTKAAEDSRTPRPGGPFAAH
jgi:hypothetical protein